MSNTGGDGVESPKKTLDEEIDELLVSMGVFPEDDEEEEEIDLDDLLFG